MATLWSYGEHLNDYSLELWRTPRWLLSGAMENTSMATPWSYGEHLNDYSLELWRTPQWLQYEILIGVAWEQRLAQASALVNKT